MRVQALGWEDPLEEGTVTHSSILAWRTPRQRSLAGYSPWGCKGSDTTERLGTQHPSTGALALEWGSGRTGGAVANLGRVMVWGLRLSPLGAQNCF